MVMRPKRVGGIVCDLHPVYNIGALQRTVNFAADTDEGHHRRYWLLITCDATFYNINESWQGSVCWIQHEPQSLPTLKKGTVCQMSHIRLSS